VDPDLPGLPQVEQPTPDLPLPSVPSLLPETDGPIRLPGAPADEGTAGGSTGSTVPLPDLGVCLPPLPAISDC
jgi:hypothetical protein